MQKTFKEDELIILNGMSRKGRNVSFKKLKELMQMKAVMKRVPPDNKGCPECRPDLGILWLCKKHSPIVSISHLGFWRWLWTILTVKYYW